MLATHKKFAEYLGKLSPTTRHDTVREGGNTGYRTAAFTTAAYRALGEAWASRPPELQRAMVTEASGGTGEEPAEEAVVPPGAAAISFKGKVSPQVAAVIKKIHQNLGHPPNRELVKHLRLSGATPAMIQAAQQL